MKQALQLLSQTYDRSTSNHALVTSIARREGFVDHCSDEVNGSILSEIVKIDAMSILEFQAGPISVADNLSVDKLAAINEAVAAPMANESAPKKSETNLPFLPTDEAATIRVTNLSQDVQYSDLRDLFRPFGQIARIYLPKDKVTGQSKGFTFINFLHREDAARAIATVNGYGYDNLILSVEWAK
ncbi:hypothetical protein MRX96_034760 [Rhipicephalus microplus]